MVEQFNNRIMWHGGQESHTQKKHCQVMTEGLMRPREQAEMEPMELMEGCLIPMEETPLNEQSLPRPGVG